MARSIRLLSLVCLAIVSGIAIAPAAARTADARMPTIDQLISLRRNVSARISPDGSRVA